jgi:hypothetical protein
MPAMVNEYMAWHAERGDEGWSNTMPMERDGDVDGVVNVQVLNIFCRFLVAPCPLHQLIAFTIDRGVSTLKLQSTDVHSIAPVFLRYGLLPCSPDNPKLAISIRTMEIYRVLRFRSPRLAIQQFTRGLLDLHLCPPSYSLSNQFSIAFDLYNAILHQVKQRIMQALGRDTPAWRLRNACPACQYKLHDEPKFRFSMLLAMDGNNSAKRIPKRKLKDDGVALVSSERTDTREGGGDYFLSREDVDKWAEEAVNAAVHAPVSH